MPMRAGAGRPISLKTTATVALACCPSLEFVDGGTRDAALIGDLNGDAFGDVAQTSSIPASSAYTITSNGDGTYAIADSPSPTPEDTGDPNLIDLDGDGDTDFIFVSDGEGAGIDTFFNDGSGGRQAGTPFGLPLDLGENGNPGSVEVGEFDGDPGIEIIVAGAREGDADPIAPGLRIFDLVDTGSGLVFEESAFDPSIVGNVLGAADYDGDDDLDLLLAGLNFSGPHDLRLLLNDGSGDFTDAGVVVDPFDPGTLTFFGPAVGVEFFDDPLMVA